MTDIDGGLLRTEILLAGREALARTASERGSLWNRVRGLFSPAP